MNATIQSECKCAACPGAGCTCGCQEQAERKLAACAPQCQCGADCRCGAECACAKGQG